MKRFGLALFAVMALCVVAVRPATAQNVRWGVGAGLLLPTSDYANSDKLGFTGGLGGTYYLPGGLGIRVDASYGTTSEKSGIAAHTTKILGGMGTVIVSTPKGVMTDKQARSIGQGGEVLCVVA